MSSGSEPPGECDPEHLLERCKEKLGVYRYSSARTVVTRKYADRDMNISLLSNEDYRMIFYTKELPLGSEIRIYDRSRRDIGRNLLVEWVKTGKGWDFFIFDMVCEESGSVHLDYKIPEADRNSCFSFLLGYKLHLFKD